ncbi:unnamed protein product [Cyclocybe aegerita]|uniref:Uncharacterized protein n=1 Tax=Cyclocybe aegerita TaxID=1973307 RepID=A0A8S0WEP2_CYCAE|nr:unnamed protein product [Cyclocybe aegerita]
MTELRTSGVVEGRLPNLLIAMDHSPVDQVLTLSLGRVSMSRESLHPTLYARCFNDVDILTRNSPGALAFQGSVGHVRRYSDQATSNDWSIVQVDQDLATAAPGFPYSFRVFIHVRTLEDLNAGVYYTLKETAVLRRQDPSWFRILPPIHTEGLSEERHVQSGAGMCYQLFINILLRGFDNDSVFLAATPTNRLRFRSLQVPWTSTVYFEDAARSFGALKIEAKYL